MIVHIFRRNDFRRRTIGDTTGHRHRSVGIDVEQYGTGRRRGVTDLGRGIDAHIRIATRDLIAVAVWFAAELFNWMLIPEAKVTDCSALRVTSRLGILAGL